MVRMDVETEKEKEVVVREVQADMEEDLACVIFAPADEENTANSANIADTTDNTEEDEKEEDEKEEAGTNTMASTEETKGAMETKTVDRPDTVAATEENQDDMETDIRDRPVDTVGITHHTHTSTTIPKMNGILGLDHTARLLHG